MGNAVLQGVEGVIGMGIAAPMAAAAVGAASMAPAFMPDVPMQSFQEQRPNDRRNRDQPMRQAAQNNIQARHNRGQGPASFVDTRTLNGQNHLKPKDKKVRMGNSKPTGWGDYTGIIGGSSSSGATPAGFAMPQPSAPEPDLPPAAPPSFNDMLAKIKQAPMIGTGARPRERSPRRDNPERKPHWTRLLQPENRAAAMELRPKELPVRGSKRKRDDMDPNPSTRKPPPKPDGRLKARKPRAQPPPPPPAPPAPPPPSAGKKMQKKGDDKKSK
jgi:hypothetical protein